MFMSTLGSPHFGKLSYTAPGQRLRSKFRKLPLRPTSLQKHREAQLCIQIDFLLNFSELNHLLIVYFIEEIYSISYESNDQS